MPDTYTTVFGGQNRSPAQLSYVAYEIDASIELQWPFIAEDDAFVAMAKIDILANDSGLSVMMPRADVVSVGQDVLFRNTGAQPFVVLDQDGGTIVSLASGEEWFIWITDNDTEAGVWGTVQFGTGVSNANAAALAGAGLRAAITRLDQNLIITPLGGNHLVDAGDRATVLMNNGGVAAHTFPSAASLGNGWFDYEINAGSGALTLVAAGGDTIDGQATKVLNPGESCVVFSDGVSGLHTLGYGRSLVNTITGASINLAPGGTHTLTPTEVKAQVQDFNGTLTANAVVEYGTGVGYWFVWNNTAGAFTVTARADSLDPGALIPQGAFSILRSNGANVDIAFTATSGTVTQINTATGELVGGPITSSGTIGLANTAVTPGTYGGGSSVPVITVDQKGRITSASSVTLGTAALFDAGGSPGDVPVLDADGLVPSVNGGVPTGAVFDIVVPGLPAGYVYCVGSIGDATSGASNRANADCHSLFLKLWLLPLSVVTPGPKGVSGETDWLAHKRIDLPDFRGRSRIGRDNMLGVAAGRVTSPFAAPDGNTIMASGGQQSESVAVSGSFSGSGAGHTTGELPVTVSGTTGVPVEGSVGAPGSGTNVTVWPHVHTFTGTGTTDVGSSLPVVVDAVTGTIAGTTALVTNLPPFLIVDTIVKL